MNFAHELVNTFAHHMLPTHADLTAPLLSNVTEMISMSKGGNVLHSDTANNKSIRQIL